MASLSNLTGAFPAVRARPLSPENSKKTGSAGGFLSEGSRFSQREASGKPFRQKPVFLDFFDHPIVSGQMGEVKAQRLLVILAA